MVTTRPHIIPRCVGVLAASGELGYFAVGERAKRKIKVIHGLDESTVFLRVLKDDVRGLQVAVGDSVMVEMVQTAEDLERSSNFTICWSALIALS